jgi:hypothetical protein
MKLLRFNHAGKRVTLKGLKDKLSSFPKLKPSKLKGLLRKGGLAQMIHLFPNTPQPPMESIPEPIQQIVAAHSHLF